MPDDDPRAQSASSRGNRADNTNRPRQVIRIHGSISEIFCPVCVCLGWSEGEGSEDGEICTCSRKEKNVDEW